MKNAYVFAFALCMVPPALAQERDAYGNRIAPDVAKHRAEEARREAIRDAIRARRVIPGMTELEVRSSLGDPARINDSGGFVQWVYDHALDQDGRVKSGSTYVYFRNGVTR